MPDRRRFVAMGLLTLITCHAGLFPYALRSSSAHAQTLPSSSLPPGSDTGTSGRILVIGDSLSAEYGLPKGSGWVTHIAERLQDHGTGYQIHNSSISGDTTRGGVSRLPAALERVEPDIVIIELGSNDALRGLSLDAARDNLAEMIQAAQDTGAQVILTGMQIPPNYGPQYASQFAGMFPELAETYQTVLVPFLMDGFATQRDMFLDDGIHPNESAQVIIADTVWEHLKPLVVSPQKD